MSDYKYSIGGLAINIERCAANLHYYENLLQKHTCHSDRPESIAKRTELQHKIDCNVGFIENYMKELRKLLPNKEEVA